MQETQPVKHRPHDDEKDEVTHLENVNSHTPPSEIEKGQPLAPTVSRGPVVHEKVSMYPCIVRAASNEVKDERQTIHDPNLHVISLDRLPNPIVPFRLCPTAHISRYRRCRSLHMVRHWVSDPKCRPVSLRRRPVRSLWTPESGYSWTSGTDHRSHKYVYLLDVNGWAC